MVLLLHAALHPADCDQVSFRVIHTLLGCEASQMSTTIGVGRLQIAQWRDDTSMQHGSACRAIFVLVANILEDVS